MKKPDDYHIKRSAAALEANETFHGQCSIIEHWKTGFDTGYESALVDLEENYYDHRRIREFVYLLVGCVVGIVLAHMQFMGGMA